VLEGLREANPLLRAHISVVTCKPHW